MAITKLRCDGFHIFTYLIIVVLLQVTKVRACDPTCKDKGPVWCILQKPDCTKLRDATLCPATCKLCTPCQALSAICEVDTCYDRISDLCWWMKFKGHCMLIGGLCRKTCGKCVPCVTPDPPANLPCSNDCVDMEPGCPRWADDGHCYTTSPHYEHVTFLCQQSCKLCLPCTAPFFEKEIFSL